MHPPAKHGPYFPRPPPSCHTHKSPRAGQSHTVATRKEHASPFPTPPRLGAPRWILHSVSYALPPGSPACVRGRSCSEARSRQRPAHGWPRRRRLPIPAGPTPKVRDRGGCGEWRLHGLRARTRGGQLHSGSAGDCPRPRPGLALHSSARPGGTREEEVADSWWGEFGKFVLSADWVAPGPELGPAGPAPLWRRRKVPRTQP